MPQLNIVDPQQFLIIFSESSCSIISDSKFVYFSFSTFTLYQRNSTYLKRYLFGLFLSKPTYATFLPFNQPCTFNGVQQSLHPTLLNWTLCIFRNTGVEHSTIHCPYETNSKYRDPLQNNMTQMENILQKHALVCRIECDVI